MAERTEGAQAIVRATEVLRAVARIQHSGATLPTVSRTTNLTRSTAFRILRALTEERFLTYQAARHRYTISPLAYELGLAAPAESEATRGSRRSAARFRLGWWSLPARSPWDDGAN